MQRIPGRIKNEKFFLLASLIYAAAVLGVFPYLRYYVDNPDTISYITIAHKYALHDYSNAINGYWSPLLSWILALLFTIPRDEIYLFKLLQLLIGWFALFNFGKLIASAIHSKNIQLVLTIACIPFLLSYALLNLTADLLFLTVILFYLRIVSEKEFYNHRHFGLIAGVLGILLYFSKSFGFCFFLVHFTVLTLKIYLQTREYAFKRHIINNYFQAIICFAFISAIWIYLISDKYGHFTISENASFNLSKEVASGPEQENILPVLSEGLTRPVNAGAVNAWEDPGLGGPTITPLHPFSASGDFGLYEQVLKRNLLTIYYFDFRRQTGIVFIIILVAFLIYGKRKKIYSDDLLFSLFCTLIFVYGGYSLILVHTRYIWVCTLIMLLLSVWLLEELQSKTKAQQIFIKVFFILLVTGLALKRPVKEILFSSDKNVATSVLLNSIMHPFRTMNATYSPDKYFFEVRKEIKAIILPGEAIASLKNPVGVRDGYTQASLLALASNSKYLGQISAVDEESRDLMDNLKVDHLIIFSAEQNLGNSVHWKLEYSNENLPLKIYRKRD